MRVLIVLMLLAISSGTVAQQPARDVLQRQIVERLIENFIMQGGLDEEQTARFRATFQRQMRDRRASEANQRQLIQALESQLRPGVAANVDSLTTLLEALRENRQAQLDGDTQYQAEYASYLSPVQQAQLVLMVERFQRQIDNLLRRRVGASRPNGN